MKVVMIHGQTHKGVTYTMAHQVLNSLSDDTLEVREFFLPKDGPECFVVCKQEKSPHGIPQIKIGG